MPNLKAIGVGLLLALIVAGCGSTTNDNDAIRSAIDAHLARNSNLNVAAFDTEVQNVNVQGNEAKADVAFRVKGGPGVMQLTYDLKKTGGTWAVVQLSPVGSNFTHPVPDGNGMAAPGWKLWEALESQLAGAGLLDDYDLVFLDTPPALGYLTINALSAADILLVPLGASFLEFDSTGRFFDMLHATFASIEEGENMAARALGREELAFEWDAVQAVITRFDAAQQTEMASLLQSYMGRTLSPFRQDFTALIGQAGESVNGIYEPDYRDFNRDTYARGRATFDQTYAAFKRLLYGIWRRDELAAREVAAQ